MILLVICVASYSLLAVDVDSKNRNATEICTQKNSYWQLKFTGSVQKHI